MSVYHHISPSSRVGSNVLWQWTGVTSLYRELPPIRHGAAATQHPIHSTIPYYAVQLVEQGECCIVLCGGRSGWNNVSEWCGVMWLTVQVTLVATFYHDHLSQHYTVPVIIVFNIPPFDVRYLWNLPNCCYPTEYRKVMKFVINNQFCNERAWKT